jgi:hypothetical protein
VIYVDTSVVLARLFSETRRPADSFWAQTLISSALLQYEVWNRLHAMAQAGSLGTVAEDLVGRIQLLDLAPAILNRALAGFPVPVRTLDGLHLASMDFLVRQGRHIELATFDTRLAIGARALGIPLLDL